MKAPAALSIIVLLHHAVAFVHGGDHEILAIEMALWQNLFINGVIVALPLLGVIALWTKYDRLGLIAIIVGMVGALVFGVVHHYMLISPDHISHLPAGEAHVHESFQLTAGLIAMLEGIAAALAAFMYGRVGRAP